MLAQLIYVFFIAAAQQIRFQRFKSPRISFKHVLAQLLTSLYYLSNKTHISSERPTYVIALKL